MKKSHKLSCLLLVLALFSYATPVFADAYNICWVRNDSDIRSSTESGYGWSFYGQLVTADLGTEACALDPKYWDSETNLCASDGSADGCGFVPNLNGFEDDDADSYPKQWIWFDTSLVDNDGDGSLATTTNDSSVDKLVFESPLTIGVSQFTLIGNPSPYVANAVDDTSVLLDYNNQLRDDTTTYTTDARDNVLDYNYGTVVLDFRTNFDATGSTAIAFNTDGTTEAPSKSSINWENFPIKCKEDSAPVALWNTILLLPDNFINKGRANSKYLKDLIFTNVPCLRDYGANYICAGNLRADASNYIDPSSEAEGALIKLQNESWCEALPNENDWFGNTDFDELFNEWWPDVDGDGFGDEDSTPIQQWREPEGYADNNGDCDDADSSVNPDAREICDGIDNDCDGLIDEFWLSSPEVCDGYDNDCNGLVDDGLSSVEEICDGRDNDCDGGVDENSTTEVCDGADNDCDGSIDENATTEVCDGADNDCDGRVDENATDEVCDGADNDCDGSIDENLNCGTIYYYDSDGDGFGDDAVTSTTGGTGYVEVGGDCDDDDSTINPDAAEVCDGADNNCDGAVDVDSSGSDICPEGTIYYDDVDGDGYGDPDTASTTEPSGTYSTNGEDCNDGNSDINPAAEEICDDIDNNCDGLVDVDSSGGNVCTVIYYDDVDGDGYGDPDTASTTEPTGSHSTNGDDCDDSDSGVNPGAIEVCDGVDNDCDGAIDENLATVTESCDELDNNCNGEVDENCIDGETLCSDGFDNDGNGFQDCDDAACDCSDADGDGYSIVDLDCDDTDPLIHPGATERCNLLGIDYDCDGETNDDNICIGTNLDLDLSESVGGGGVQADGGRLINCSLVTTASQAPIGTQPLFTVSLVSLLGLWLTLRRRLRVN